MRMEQKCDIWKSNEHRKRAKVPNILDNCSDTLIRSYMLL